jgi:hypothetical protein
MGSQLSFSLFPGSPALRWHKVIAIYRATSAFQPGQTIVAIEAEDFGITFVYRQLWARGLGNY